jgi:hypothetical protein
MQELFKYTWGLNIWKAAKKCVGEKDNLQNAYVHLFFCIIVLFHATVFLKNSKVILLQFCISWLIIQEQEKTLDPLFLSYKGLIKPKKQSL